MRLHRQTFCGKHLQQFHYQSPVGPLGVLISPNGLRAILWPQDLMNSDIKAEWKTISQCLPSAEISTQLDEYFRGKRKKFTLKLDLVGSDFQKKVWQSLASIDFGTTCSYSEQAKQVASINHTRAVASANARNPVSIVLPCHRVIGRNGSLTGFAGGLTTKNFLINHERSFSRTQINHDSNLDSSSAQR